MATVSGANPLSLGQYNAEAGGAPASQAAGGLSALAGAFAPQGQQLNQARYLGAETARAQAQTGQINQQQQDLATATSLLQDPNALTDPAKAQQVGALLVKYPEQGKALAQIISTMRAGATAAGGSVPGGAAATDQFASSTGVAPAGNTMTGLNADLSNRTKVAGIGAGATVAAANIGANASMTNARGEQEGLDRRTLVQTGDAANGVAPTYVPAAQAAGKPAYDSPLANTIAGNTSQMKNVVAPGGGTTLMSAGNVAKTGANIRLSSPAEVQGAVAQNAITPPPPASAANPASTPPGASVVTPDQNQRIVEGQVTQTANGAQKPPESTIKDGPAINAQISAKIAALHSNFAGIKNVSPELMNLVTQRMAQLRATTPALRDDPVAALNQAVTDTAGPNGENLDSTGAWSRMPAFMLGGSAPSAIILKQGAPSPLAAGMTAPPPSPSAGAQPPPTAANSPVPQHPAANPGAPPGASPLAGAFGIPHPMPPPQGTVPNGPTPPVGVPTAAPQAASQPSAPAAVPPGVKTATGPGGQRIALVNGRWVPIQ